MHNVRTGGARGMRHTRRLGLAGLLAATGLIAPGWAMAQQGAGPAAAPAPPQTQPLQEVVVTARRREERLQDVPVSIVAIGSQQLNRQSVTTANDLARVAPGLSIMNTAASRETTTYSIRGQGSTFGSGPGVIPYFADVANFSSAIFDLQSVQVLKGPQGTLFGRNTSGGAILFTPQMPTKDFSGFVLGRFGNYGRKDLEFGVGGPIVEDKVMFRISGQLLNRDGFTTVRSTGQKLDNEDRQYIRGILTVRPTDTFENTTIIQGGRQHENGDGAVLSHLTPGSPLLPLLQPQLALQQSLGIRTVLGDFPFQFKSDTFGVINTSTWTINETLTLKNIASYSKTNGYKAWDLDAMELPLLGVLNPATDTRQYTEEIQARLNFGRVSGAVGYYLERMWTPFNIAFVEVSPILFHGSLITAESGYSISHGPYAQFDWKLTPKLTLTTGARYTTDNIYAGQTGNSFSPTLPLPPTSQIPFLYSPSVAKNFNTVTWNFAAEYAVDPSANIYAHVARGYKQGGFNGTAPPALQAYQPEYVIDYELGVKGRHSFGPVLTRYDVDIFYDDYTNIQRDENVTLPNGAVNTVIQNAAAGRIQGVEFQFTVVPTSYFQLSAAYTYLDAKYNSFNGGPGVGDVSKSSFPNTPANQLTITPMVTFPIPKEEGDLTFQANIYHQSKYTTDAFNVPNGNRLVDTDVPGAQAPGYTRLDLRLDWSHIKGSALSVGLYGLNVTNTKYIVGTDNQLNSLGFQSTLYSPPAFYGIELRYEFGRRH